MLYNSIQAARCFIINNVIFNLTFLMEIALTNSGFHLSANMPTVRKFSAIQNSMLDSSSITVLYNKLAKLCLL